MDDQLKSLKKLSHEKAFPGLQFTSEIQQNVYKEIRKKKEKDEDILLAIFQLLNEKRRVSNYCLTCAAVESPSSIRMRAFYMRFSIH